MSLATLERYVKNLKANCVGMLHSLQHSSHAHLLPIQAFLPVMHSHDLQGPLTLTILQATESWVWSQGTKLDEGQLVSI